MRILLLLLLLASPLSAATRKTLTFTWDPNSPIEKVTHYKIFVRIGAKEPFRYFQVAELRPPGLVSNKLVVTSAPFTAGVYTFVLQPINSRGAGPYSNPIVVRVPK